jgi:N-acetylmuramoyl-L-alanine amidase
MKRFFLPFAFSLLGLASLVSADAQDIDVSTTPIIAEPLASSIVVVHPAEGARLPPISEAFVFGSVPPGSSLTLNGMPVALHRKGGFLVMVPVQAGEVVLSFLNRTPKGETSQLDRRFTVAHGFTILPSTPAVLEKGSVSPTDDMLLTAGDMIRVAFQGSPGGQAEFSIDGVAPHLPMAEIGTFPSKNNVNVSTMSARGVYEGMYVLQPGDKASRAGIEVTLKKEHDLLKAKAAGKLTIENGGTPRVGIITEDTLAVRTSPEGGYDVFLYRGMRVRLTGKIGSMWRVGLSSLQSGWIKESAVVELPHGTPPAKSMLTNFTMTHQAESTIIRVPLGEALPYRSEQFISPTQLVITLYGAVDKTDLIKYDPADSLIRQIRWRQIAPDTCQLVIDPTFKQWWGYDVRYEGTTLVIEVRKPLTATDIKGLVIAVDPGHGGSDSGATGPHETLEKDANLAIAKVVAKTLEKAGAKPFLTREKDIDVPLYERPRIAWNHNARLFISIHCNAAGEGENPLANNGFSIYSYQPQSNELAHALHTAYSKTLNLPDHGLFFADLAVCRMTQMPAVLTEQAYIIVPDQEDLIFKPEFQRKIAASILSGIRALFAKP